MNKFKLIALAPVLLTLAACEVGPDYERPSVETPAAYKEGIRWEAAQPNDAINRGMWWMMYNDPVLNHLEDQVEVSNQNLKAAEAAYREARAVVDETRSSLFPTLTANGGANQSGQIAGHVKPVTTYSANLGASWDVDVWGSIRRSVESSEANAQASAAELASAKLSAQASLASDYFNLRAQDELMRILNADAEDDKKALKITQNQYDVGVAAKADVLAAQTQLESVQSSAINAGVARAQYEHAIAVLTGVPPSALNIEPKPFATTIPAIPSEAPSVLLERRPDIASAERAVVAANAEIGVETAAWYPSVTLAGSAGYTAVALSKLFQASNSLWSIGPQIAETIFDGGAREARVEEAKASYEQTVANYRQTVLTSFQQVEDNLSSLRILGEQGKISDAAVSDAKKSYQLTLNQYQSGIVPYSSVLTAENTVLTNEQASLAVRQNDLVASVGLIQALGGGWTADQLPKY